MGFRESIASILGRKSTQEEDGLCLLTEDEGTSFYASPDKLAEIKSGCASSLAGAQYVALTMLCESGQAHPISNGVFVPSESIACLEEDILSVLQLPPRAPLKFQIKVDGKSTHPGFKAFFNQSRRTTMFYEPAIAIDDGDNISPLNTGS